MTGMTETAAQRRERQERQGRQIAAYLRAAPHEPMATRAEVLEVPCPVCGAEAGAECGTAFPRSAWAAGMLFRGFSGVHLRRYLDRTGDPR
jgi:hypothetical protein